MDKLDKYQQCRSFRTMSKYSRVLQMMDQEQEANVVVSSRSFTVWQLRTGYLTNIKDGVGERLINMNSSVLNAPGLRAAGWPIVARMNAAQIGQMHSPPIPTNTGVASEYFQNVNRASRQGDRNGDEEDDEVSGMVTGGRRSPNVVDNFAMRRRKHGKRIRQAQRARQDDDDSSDLSDDSDEESER